MQKKTQGQDFNYFREVLVNVSDFPDNSQVTFNIKGSTFSFSLINEGTVPVYYSFNGNVLHGSLRPGSPSQAIFFDNRPVTAIWFRTPSPGDNPVVRVEAWGRP